MVVDKRHLYIQRDLKMMKKKRKRARASTHKISVRLRSQRVPTKKIVELNRDCFGT